MVDFVNVRLLGGEGEVGLDFNADVTQEGGIYEVLYDAVFISSSRSVGLRREFIAVASEVERASYIYSTTLLRETEKLSGHLEILPFLLRPLMPILVIAASTMTNNTVLLPFYSSTPSITASSTHRILDTHPTTCPTLHIQDVCDEHG